MLCTEQDILAGSVSGGCLDSDILERARSVIQSGKSETVVYDSRSPSDIVWGLGLGCNGLVRVLIEALDPAARTNPLNLLDACLKHETSAVMATVCKINGDVASKTGERLTIYPDGEAIGTIADEALRKAVMQDVQTRSPRLQTCNYKLETGEATVLFEVIQAPLRVLIFGAGNDAIPLVQWCRRLGWRITVVDTRPAYATRQRFLEADTVVVARADELPAQHLDRNTIAIVMTHNYPQDLAALRRLLQTPRPYLGLLGPRQRKERLLNDLRNEGLNLTAECAQCLYAPAGLDIGAETPEEVALAIVAEIQAVLAQRSGGSLRERLGPIHTPADAETHNSFTVDAVFA
jgi:xanthine/CO dehydrogenase XdhC/CoxF family maturation factor